MIGFSNLDSLICLCGARNRFGPLAFTGDEGGRPAYTADDLAKAVNAIKISGDKTVEIKSLIADSRRVAPASAFFAVADSLQTAIYTSKKLRTGVRSLSFPRSPAPNIFRPYGYRLPTFTKPFRPPQKAFIQIRTNH